MPMNSSDEVASQEPTTDNVLFDVRDKLTRIRDLNELMFMAGEGLLKSSRSAGSSITAGCEVIDEILEEACALIDRRGA